MRRRVTLAVLSLLVAAILIGSFVPIETKMWLGTTGRHAHRILHLASFGVTALLLISLARTLRGRIAMALAVCALAFFVEAGEKYAFGGSMEWHDVRDDSLGVAAALLISALRRVLAGSSNRAASGK